MLRQRRHRPSDLRATGPHIVRRLVVGVVTPALFLLGACSSNTSPDPSAAGTTSSAAAPAEPVKVAGSVVSTAGSADEMNVVVPAPIAQAWSELGQSGSGLEWVSVAGDGMTTTEPVDLKSDAAAATSELTDKINQAQAKAPGRSALAGLAAVDSPKGSPVWVFSPLLDTDGALDFNQLAFDESPPTAIKAAKAAKAIPDLTGRDVTFVVTPVAGKQKKLSKLQVGYQRAIWEGLATSAGAASVTFFDGTGTTPGTGTIPPVPVPDPNDKINSEEQGTTRTCTLPSPALFVPDQPTLIDKAATLKALDECVGTLDATTRITVAGHTAGTPGGDEAFAKDLSTRRATEVAALLRELDVPAKNIAEVVGYGSSRPLVEPSSDPGNRAVVVTLSSTG